VVLEEEEENIRLSPLRPVVRCSETRRRGGSAIRLAAVRTSQDKHDHTLRLSAQQTLLPGDVVSLELQLSAEVTVRLLTARCLNFRIDGLSTLLASLEGLLRDYSVRRVDDREYLISDICTILSINPTSPFDDVSVARAGCRIRRP